MNNSLPKSIKLLPCYEAPSSWWQHVPIAHWLVETLKPKVIVELGTHYGVSFFSFCEAARNYSQDTFIFAVDTWEGDKQAGYYDQTVYDKVKQHQEMFHKERSSLLKTTFSEASKHFKDKSIDMIHIDGLHTYEAVKQDYEIWRPKLKEGGSILFHDWNVREGEFGVWRLWDEIKTDKSMKCLQVPNGHGLGIATMSDETPNWHLRFSEISDILKSKGLILEQLSEIKLSNKVAREELVEAKKEVVNIKMVANELKKHAEEQEKAIKYLRGGKVLAIIRKIMHILKKRR